MDPLYFDYNGSSPIAPEVAEAMQPFLSGAFGNPSNAHWAGKPARVAIERAREQVADLLGCSPKEVVFTSGGTESDNFAIKGVFYKYRSRGAHFVTTSVEHPAVLLPLEFLAREHGAAVTRVPVDRECRVDPEAIADAMRADTILVTVMHSQNEVGTLQPIREIAGLCAERAVLLHSDAAQSVGKLPIDVKELGVDLLTVAGHKLQAPKGVGALYIRDGVELEPLIHGAGHERGLRSGTENVVLIVGLGAACALAKEHLAANGSTEVRANRDRLEAGLREILGEEAVLNGHPTDRLPNTLNLNFSGRIGKEVLDSLEDVAASTGASCHTGVVRLSPVLEAMGVPKEVGMGAVRFSIGRETSSEDVDRLIEKVRSKVK